MCPYRADLRLLPNALHLSAYSFRLRKLPQPQMIWLRAFHEIYNPSLALKVCARLSSAFPDVRLTMIGPDKGDGSLHRLRQLATELAVTEQIAIHDKVPKAQVPDWITRGDIFLNTSSVDNTPVSVLEAMACGLCVVSTRVGGIPYLLQHERDALLVPPNDPEAMAAAVRRILTEPALAEHLSHNARQKAEQFDWSAILPQWQALLTSVAERQAG
jgi:L-malate glycosyltransferase